MEITKDWKEFVVGELFPSIVKPAVYHAHELEETVDGIPYVVRSKFNNGIKCRVKDTGSIRTSPKGVLSFGAENSSFFYQAERWCSGRDIYYVDTSNLSQNTCLFLASCFQVLAAKYEYNYGLFPDLLRKEVIKLPVDCEGAPDWTYMDAYIGRLSNKARTMLNVFTQDVNFGGETKQIDITEWKLFPVDELFSVVPGTRLRKQDMKEGNINYVGASAFNNGITSKIGNTEAIHSGGVITVCYNGSVGRAFYQDEPFWASDDVNVLCPKFKLTPAIAKFIIPVIYRVGSKYEYIDKWTTDRIKAASLPLPVSTTGEPDWPYMEEYIRRMEVRARNILNYNIQ